MHPTARLRWRWLDCISLPLDGFPAARVNRNGEAYFYILEQWWYDDKGDEPGGGQWRPVAFKDEGT